MTGRLGIGIGFPSHEGKMWECETCLIRGVKAFPGAAKPEEVWPLAWSGTVRKPNRKVCVEVIMPLPWPYTCNHISLPLVSAKPQPQEKKDEGERSRKSGAGTHSWYQPFDSILNSGPNPAAITKIKDYKTWLRLITTETRKAQKLLEGASKIPQMGP